MRVEPTLGSIGTSVVQHLRVVRPVAARFPRSNRPTDADAVGRAAGPQPAGSARSNRPPELFLRRRVRMYARTHWAAYLTATHCKIVAFAALPGYHPKLSLSIKYGDTRWEPTPFSLLRVSSLFPYHTLHAHVPRRRGSGEASCAGWSDLGAIVASLPNPSFVLAIAAAAP